MSGFYSVRPLQTVELPGPPLLDTALTLLFFVSVVGMVVVYAVYLVTVLRDWVENERGQTPEGDEPRVRERLGWWVLFLLPTITTGYLLVGFFGGPLGFSLPFEILAAVTFGVLGLHLLAPLAFHVDSSYVQRETAWKPSGVYYLTIVATGVGALLAALYLYQRRRHFRGAETTTQTTESPDTDAGSPDSNGSNSTTGIGPAWLPTFSRRDVLKAGAIGYGGYVAYQFVGPWLENETKQVLFGSEPDLEYEPTGWPMQNYDPKQTAANRSARLPTENLSVETLYSGRDPNAEDGPVWSDGVVYFCDRSAVKAVDVETSETLWTYRRKETGTFADGETWATPHAIATDGEFVFVSINLGLAALDAETGEKQWHYRTGSLFRELTFAGNTAFIGEFGITAIDTTIGTRRWQVEWNTGPSTPPAVADGTVFGSQNVSIEDGDHEWILRAFDGKNGDSKWTRRVDLGTDAYAVNTPVHRGTLYFGGAHLFAFDAETGDTAWKRKNAIDGDSAYSLVADGDRLYSIPTGSSGDSRPVRAFDASDGKRLWSRETPSDTAVEGAIAGSTLCLTFENALRLVDSETGELLSEVEQDFGFPDPPRVADDAIFTEGWEEMYRIFSE